MIGPVPDSFREGTFSPWARMQREKVADACRPAWPGLTPWWVPAAGPSRGIEAAFAPPHCFKAAPSSVPVSRLRGGASLVRAGRPPLRELARGGTTPCLCRHASSLFPVFFKEPATLVLAWPEELLVEPPQANSVKLTSRAPSTATGADRLAVLFRRGILFDSLVQLGGGGPCRRRRPPPTWLPSIARGRSRLLLPR